MLNLNAPVKISRNYNIKRIAEVWLGFRKDFVYHNTKTNAKDISKYEEQVIQVLKSKTQAMNCQNFEWYLKNIAKGIATPSAAAQEYGLLRCGSGRCVHIGPDNRTDLGSCKPETLKLPLEDIIFELTNAKLIKQKNKCLAARSSAYVVLENCKPEDTKQHWELTEDNKLINVWSNYCAMHVTDPDKKSEKGRQIMMVQECENDKDGKFTDWEFLAP